MLIPVLVHIAMVICFLSSLFFSIAKFTGSTFARIVVKIGTILGILAPIIFYLMFFGVIPIM